MGPVPGLLTSKPDSSYRGIFRRNIHWQTLLAFTGLVVVEHKAGIGSIYYSNSTFLFLLMSVNFILCCAFMLNKVLTMYNSQHFKKKNTHTHKQHFSTKTLIRNSVQIQIEKKKQPILNCMTVPRGGWLYYKHMNNPISCHPLAFSSTCYLLVLNNISQQ